MFLLTTLLLELFATATSAVNQHHITVFLNQISPEVLGFFYIFFIFFDNVNIDDDLDLLNTYLSFRPVRI